MRADRKPPARVQPVSAGGIRYEALQWGKGRGLKQNGGYIAAVDEARDKELWILKIYDVRYDARAGDAGDVFITSLALDEAGERLTIGNQAGRSFVVDLKTREVAPA